LAQGSDPERKVHNTLLIQLSRDKIKGAKYAVEAISQLLARNRNLTIYTFGDYDIPLGLNERWQHFRNISDQYLRHLYEKCEIFVSPVVEAGVPGSAVEAMINGCATITTDVSGARELVNPGVNGLIIPPRDSYSIVSSVESLLSNVETVKLLARNGRMIKYQFSTENMAKTFLRAVDYYENRKY
jgi:glycosyltransferase involved in cell wall biosynthesis